MHKTKLMKKKLMKVMKTTQKHEFLCVSFLNTYIEVYLMLFLRGTSVNFVCNVELIFLREILLLFEKMQTIFLKQIFCKYKCRFF